MDLIRVSRFLSLVLRHKPEAIGLTLNGSGWLNIDEMLQSMPPKFKITREQLNSIVESDDKKRYSFSVDATMIRANQGHSIAVDLGLRSIRPPGRLYHGTGRQYVPSIKKGGLIKKNRQYVHLSVNSGTARAVGLRHGHPVILEICSGLMHENGYEFFVSENRVWLVNEVPIAYITFSSS